MNLNPTESMSTEKTSVLLSRVRTELTQEVTTVNTILTRLGRRSFGGMLILFAGLGLIPGVSVFTGFIVSVLGVQIFCGLGAPLLPKFLTAKQISTVTVDQVLGRCTQYVIFIEKWVRPRWVFMTSPLLGFVLGLVTTILGLVMMLPLPFSNLPPAIAILVLSIGQLERDGLMIFVGLVCSLAALVVGFVFAGAAFQGLQQFFA